MKKIKNMDVEWSYAGNDGPEHWHTPRDWSAEGAKFAYQSPVALEKESAETVNPQITLHHKKEEFTEKELKSTFHFVPPNTEGYVMLENAAYHLTGTHSHIPSEHLLSGKRYPPELHLVHTSDAGENLVVGCLFTITEKENCFSEVNHPMSWENGTHQWWFDPSTFLSEERLHYHYVGSLTTPSAKGLVKWFVFDTIQKMDQTFLNKIKEGMLAFNNRPLQPLNGHKIYFSND